MAGIIVGTLVWMIWPSINPILTKYEILPMIPGFILSALAIYMFSKLTRSREDNIIKENDDAALAKHFI